MSENEETQQEEQVQQEEQEQAVEKETARIQCIYPDCDRVINARGLCISHYSLARRMVKDEETTWEKMEEIGKCMPKRWHDRTAEAEWFAPSEASE